MALSRWLLLILATGCATTDASARRTAEHALDCRGSQLRLTALGELVVDPRAPLAVAIYQAEGCSALAQVLCERDDPTRCALGFEAFARGDRARARAIDRGLQLRRTASRARCDPAAVRVVQQSESLWLYRGCDTSRVYHCRRGGCVGL